MKQAKKLLGLLLALVMVLSLTVTAFAAGETGTITVDNPLANQTYTAYKIFGVTYNEGKTAYSYTIDSDAAGTWFNEVLLYMGSTWQEGTGYTGTAVTADKNGVYTGNGLTLTPSVGDGTVYVVEITKPAFSAPNFARFLNTKKDGKTGTDLTVADGVAKATGLPLGYYFVTSSNGALCNLTTTNPSATIHDKNDMPFDKVDDQESVDVGQTVNYVLTGKVPDTTGFTTYNYVITDKMSEGLTLDKDSIQIWISDDAELVTQTTAGKTVDQALNTNYYVKTTTDAKSFDNATDVDFRIDFKAIEMNAAGLFGKHIFVTYSATVNDNAVTKIERNHAILTFSNDPTDGTKTDKREDRETVYSAKIVVDKYVINKDNVNDTATKLAGAKFVLYKEVKNEGEETAHKEYYQSVQKTGENNASGNVTWSTDRAHATVLTTDANGAATFNGLQNGVYYLEETAAPDGYNLLTAPVEVEINPNGDPKDAISISTPIKTETEADAALTAEALTATTAVGNNTGSEMPETGGIGTTIFYVVGAILLVSAAVLLITKKRMSNVQ